MERLIINGTRSTPLVWIEPATRTAVIIGDSLPENAHEFYDHIVRWLAAQYVPTAGPLHWHIRLHYFNTSSAKGVYRVLHHIKGLMAAQPGHSLIWDVEEDDEFMQETGENFRELLDIDMEFRVVTEEAAVAETTRLHAAVRELGVG